MKKYLEVFKNKNIVQYIHPGPIEPLFFLRVYWLRYAIILFILLRFIFLVSSHFLVLQGAYSNTMASWISSCGALRFFTLYFWDKLHFHVLCHFFESLLCSQIHGTWSLKVLSDLLMLVHRLWYWLTSPWTCVKNIFLKYFFNLSTLGADILFLPLSHGQWHS